MTSWGVTPGQFEPEGELAGLRARANQAYLHPNAAIPRSQMQETALLVQTVLKMRFLVFAC
eukprot:3690717-Rhodomonas_salina.1